MRTGKYSGTVNEKNFTINYTFDTGVSARPDLNELTQSELISVWHAAPWYLEQELAHVIYSREVTGKAYIKNLDTSGSVLTAEIAMDGFCTFYRMDFPHEYGALPYRGTEAMYRVDDIVILEYENHVASMSYNNSFDFFVIKTDGNHVVRIKDNGEAIITNVVRNNDEYTVEVYTLSVSGCTKRVVSGIKLPLLATPDNIKAYEHNGSYVLGWEDGVTYIDEHTNPVCMYVKDDRYARVYKPGYVQLQLNTCGAMHNVTVHHVGDDQLVICYIEPRKKSAIGIVQIEKDGSWENFRLEAKTDEFGSHSIHKTDYGCVYVERVKRSICGVYGYAKTYYECVGNPVDVYDGDYSGTPLTLYKVTGTDVQSPPIQFRSVDDALRYLNVWDADNRLYVSDRDDDGKDDFDVYYDEESLDNALNCVLKNVHVFKVVRTTSDTHASMLDWCNTSDTEKFDIDTCEITSMSHWGGDVASGSSSRSDLHTSSVSCSENDVRFLMHIDYQVHSSNAGDGKYICVDIYNKSKKMLYTFGASLRDYNWKEGSADYSHFSDFIEKMRDSH